MKVQNYTIVRHHNMKPHCYSLPEEEHSPEVGLLLHSPSNCTTLADHKASYAPKVAPSVILDERTEIERGDVVHLLSQL